MTPMDSLELLQRPLGVPWIIGLGGSRKIDVQMSIISVSLSRIKNQTKTDKRIICWKWISLNDIWMGRQ